MSDKQDRRSGLLAQLLAMRDLPLPTDVEPSAPDHPLRLTPVQIDAVRAALPDEVGGWLEDRRLATTSLDAMTQDELAQIYDAAFSALMNAAPIVRSYTARRNLQSYPVWIAGIEGVYLLMVPEHDTLGPFSSLAEAVGAMERNFGEFLVGD